MKTIKRISILALTGLVLSITSCGTSSEFQKRKYLTGRYKRVVKKESNSNAQASKDRQVINLKSGTVKEVQSVNDQPTLSKIDESETSSSTVPQTLTLDAHKQEESIDTETHTNHSAKKISLPSKMGQKAAKSERKLHIRKMNAHTKDVNTPRYKSLGGNTSSVNGDWWEDFPGWMVVFIVVIVVVGFFNWLMGN